MTHPALYLLALIVLTACDVTTPPPAGVISDPQPVTNRTVLDISEPWGVDYTAMPDGKRYIAAISHDQNQLVVWELNDRVATEIARAPTGFHPDDVKWVDWNGDGVPNELLVTVEGESRVALWRFEAEKLSEISSVSVPVPPQTVNAADLDGDGRLDLVLGPYQGRQVAVLFNEGDFRFTPIDLAAAPDPIYPSIVDWNNDGRLDVLFSNYVDGAALVYLNQGDRKFEVKVLSPSGPGRPRRVIAADVNADGHLDLVMPFESVPPPYPPVAWIKLNDGAGNLSSNQPDEELLAPLGGFSDATWHGADKLLALSERDRLVLARRSEAGTWELRQILLDAWPMPLQFVDADSDGHADLLIGYSAGKQALVLWGPLWNQAEAIPEPQATTPTEPSSE